MGNVLKKVYNSVIKEMDDKEMTLTATVSTSARDRMDEVLEPKGADLKHYIKNPVVLWAHNYEQPPIGRAMWTKRTAEGIISKVKFAPTEFAREIYGLYKEGFLNAFSVGFIPKEWEDGEGKKPRRTYKSWEMLEFSAVPVPANPEALALAMQKGILKDNCIIEQIQKEIDHDETEETEEAKISEQEETETASETTADEVVVSDKSGLDDLLAENKLLSDRVSAQESEIADLKYKLYVELNKNKRASEIADDITPDKVRGLIDGAVRKALGKVN
jgi:HK97 family phage prohead protease